MALSISASTLPPKILQVFFIVALILIPPSCNPKTGNNSPLSREIDQFFKGEFPPAEPGGAILLISGDSVVFSGGYGLANMQTKEPITTKTLFNLGSISKTFVSHAVLLLHEKGMLSLEDSLFKYFPSFKSKEIAQRVKVKHLLTHTSGLPDIRDVSADTIYYLTARDEENWAPILEADSLLFEPGSEFEYSNPAFNGLALIIEKVSGMKWQKFVAENIFKPARMQSSTITDGPHPQDGVSHAYIKNDGEWVEDDYGEEPTFPAAGNGGVWSSVEDLASYEKAIQLAEFLPAKTIEDSRTVKRFDNWRGTRSFGAGWSWFVSEQRNNAFQPIIGWSWFIARTADGSKIVGHTGSQGGFLCNYVAIPEKKVLIVVLCNTPRDIMTYTNKLIEYLDIDH